MDSRIVEFVSALRSNGVRVSLAESVDSLKAIEVVGVLERDVFKHALKSTLIKEPADVPVFEQIFPLYFGSGGPDMQPPHGLTKEQQQMLERALDELRQQLQELMRMLTQGQRLSDEQLREAARKAGISRQMRGMNQTVRDWLTERMLRQLGLTPEQLRDALEALMKQLKQQGMERQARQEVSETVQQNADIMREQVSRFVGQSMLNQPNDTPHRRRIDDLMNRPLSSLNEAETAELRNHVRRLVARLRSRAALRMRRARQGYFDAKSTIRHNQRYAGVPLEIRLRKRHLKPKLTVIVDVSTSMRPVAEFMLQMVYEMQDQVSKARSFAFIDDIHDISQPFNEHRPEDAVPLVLHSIPPGHYNTDLGNSLVTFTKTFLDTVDRRTTLIFVGDGRNNYNNPRVDLVQMLKRRARRIVWMNPEPPYMWGQGDSDMPAYAPLCDAVHQVATLQQLADAVDDLFQRRA
ncbi:MAG: VWA domain-containing protein [Anaerolineae bacterium]|nr:VWA domain-containing protein [Thermoflexales bacterium]MDW8406807.1 VWA domain-containing protein [Anaerolineae bacterium]